MAFFKTASIDVIGVYQSSGKFTKCASKNIKISADEDRAITRMINLVSKDVLSSLSRVYNISDNIDDYIFPIPRTVTANVPNSNGDRFAHEELIRFSPTHRCMVYQTFRNDPLHVEHVASDPKSARGFLPDVHYIQNSDNKDNHVIAIAATDTTKDPILAAGMLSGEINKFSMGCICEAVECSICGKVAHSDQELCDCLLHHKMSKIGGELVFENCLGVEYQELSVVGNPADETAQTQAILQYNARKEEMQKTKSHFNAISSLVSKKDQVEIAKYFKDNLNKMPESMVRLVNRLF